MPAPCSAGQAGGPPCRRSGPLGRAVAGTSAARSWPHSEHGRSRTQVQSSVSAMSAGPMPGSCTTALPDRVREPSGPSCDLHHSCREVCTTITAVPTSQPSSEHVQDAGDIDVLIVGAGVSGIGAGPGDRARDAEHVTMLQRSPSYSLACPSPVSSPRRCARWTSPRTGRTRSCAVPTPPSSTSWRAGRTRRRTSCTPT